MTDATAPLLEIAGLRTWFFTSDGIVKAVDGVDITVGRGEVLGLVGESGSGKSVTMFSALRLVAAPGRVVDGSVRFDGIDVLALPEKEMRQIRGNRITMVFQQPNSSLNPCYRAGHQIAEVYRVHDQMNRAERDERAVEMLRKVGIPDPARRARAFPTSSRAGWPSAS
jgi:peptide/nickel transport system ATP-binding protein